MHRKNISCEVVFFLRVMDVSVNDQFVKLDLYILEGPRAVPLTINPDFFITETNVVYKRDIYLYNQLFLDRNTL